MNLKDFDYHLPLEAIARYPAPRREDARLLVLPREGGAPAHRGVRDLPGLLRPGDLLVVNETRVLPWRLHGKRASGGRVEALLLSREPDGHFRAMVSANRPLAEGERVRFPERREAALGPPGQIRTLRFAVEEGLEGWLEKVGEMPIPPYLGRPAEPSDRERYQTVYARVPGAVAAPTAGLHLSEALLAEIDAAGVGLARLTLHVGPGTFRPVKVERVEDHEMDPEPYEIPAGLGRRLAETRARRGRVVAVGTTVVRALEAAALDAERNRSAGPLREGAGETRLFIRPGHAFRAIDGLLTNFHLPRSTLLMLVAAFSGRERVLEAYAEAQEKGYRFYSYGDAMLIL